METDIKLEYAGVPLSADEALNKIFAITLVPPVRCIKQHDGFKVLLAKAGDLTKFLSTAGRAKLAEGGFKPVLSPEMRARCTVVARKVDRSIVAMTEHQIRDEVAAKNNVSVLEVYKPPNSFTVKIRCQALEDANKLLKDGIRLFNTLVPAYNLNQEEYYQIDQCFRC